MASVINLSKVEKDRAIKRSMQPERERGREGFITQD